MNPIMGSAVPEDLIIFTLDQIGAAKAFFDEHGMVLVRVIDQKTCDDLVLEQWEKIMEPLPWTAEHKINVAADPQTDRQGYLREVKGPFSPQKRKRYETGWCLHRGFGACCDPATFHLPGVWKLRQNPDIYALASALLGTSQLWVDVNRSFQKLPGQGESEFLHWDLNPFNIAPGTNNVCGKVILTLF
jgi:hypothetical protein